MLNFVAKALQSAHILKTTEEVGWMPSTINGVNLTIQTDTLKEALGTYWGWFEHKINEIEVPDLILPSDDTMYAKDNKFKMYQTTDHLYLVNDLEHDRFCIDAYDLNAKFVTKDFHVTHGILGAHGAAHMTIDHSHLSSCYHLIVQTLPDGRQVPGISATPADFGWDLSKSNIGFHASGSFWDGFIDMFKNLFEGKIADAIIAKVEQELVYTVPAEFNKMIAETDGAIELLPKWFMDFQTKVAPTVNDDSLSMQATGIFYDSDFPEEIPTFPTMPMEVAEDNNGVKLILSQETVQSVLDSFI